MFDEVHDKLSKTMKVTFEMLFNYILIIVKDFYLLHIESKILIFIYTIHRGIAEIDSISMCTYLTLVFKINMNCN